MTLAVTEGMIKSWMWALVVGAGLGITGCGDSPTRVDGDTEGSDPTDTDGGGSDGEDSGGVPLAPTWHEHVAPIVHAHCQPCHSGSDEVGGFDLLDYASASMWSTAIAASVDAGTMPPWSAEPTDDCTPPLPFKDDLRLTPDEIETVLAWSDDGAPEGDPQLAAPLAERPDPTIANANLVLEAGTWSMEPGATDDLRCYPLPLDFDSQKWMTAIAVEPNNATVVHHAVVFYDPTCAGLEKVDASGTYECFGTAGVPGGTVVGAWAPGGQPVRTPPNAGVPLAPGACLVMQTHYHPSPTEAQTDSGTRVIMHVTDEEPELTAEIRVMGAFEGSQTPQSFGLLPGPNDPPEGAEFLIPAGVADHTENLSIPVPDGAAGVKLWSVFPHMHVAGTRIQVELEHADGDATCVAAVPRWDFDWQRTYLFDGTIDDLPEVRAGDRVNVQCTFDNTQNNRELTSLLRAEQGTEPGEQVELLDMRLGDDTLDEMCVALIGVAY